MAEDRRGHTNALTAAYARLSDPIFPFYSLSLFFFPVLVLFATLLLFSLPLFLIFFAMRVVRAFLLFKAGRERYCSDRGNMGEFGY